MKHNAYHFVGDTLRDGTPVPANGVTLVHEGALYLCQSGYHASEDPFDALEYAPGNTLCRVHSGGQTIYSTDKLVSRERTIISRIDATQMLRRFAKLCALDVNYLWDAPEMIKQYLQSGDESLRYIACSAAYNAAKSAAYNAAKSAACSAAYSAACSAAYSAACSAAYNAAYSAACSAACSAAYNAAKSAAYGAAAQRQRERFNKMVDEEFIKQGANHET